MNSVAPRSVPNAAVFGRPAYQSQHGRALDQGSIQSDSNASNLVSDFNYRAAFQNRFGYNLGGASDALSRSGPGASHNHQAYEYVARAGVGADQNVDDSSSEDNNSESEFVAQNEILSVREIPNTYGLTVRKLELSKEHSRHSKSRHSRKSSDHIDPDAVLNEQVVNEYGLTRVFKPNVGRAIKGSMPRGSVGKQGQGSSEEGGPGRLSQTPRVYGAGPLTERVVSTTVSREGFAGQIYDPSDRLRVNQQGGQTGPAPAPVVSGHAGVQALPAKAPQPERLRAEAAPLESSLIQLVLEGVGSYEGEIKEGRFDGYGRLLAPDGRLLYEGEFSDNQFSGVGIQYSLGVPPGPRDTGIAAVPWLRFEGTFFDNRREGLGRLVLADGSEFTGRWVDGKATGEGQITWPDGRKQNGVWRENLQV